MAITVPASGTASARTTTGSLSTSVAVPSGAAVGDLLYIVASSERAEIPTVTLNGASTGLTSIRSESTTNLSVTKVVKRLVSADLGKTVTMTNSATRRQALALTVVRGAGTPVVTTQAFSLSSGTVSSKSGLAPTPAADNSAVLGLLSAVPVTATTSGYSFTSTWTEEAEADSADTSTGANPISMISFKTYGTGTAGNAQTAETFTLSPALKFDSMYDLIVIPPASNTPPVVSAGGDQTATVGSTVTLTGTATDTDGTIASRQWTAVSYPGSVPTLTGATSNTATFTAAAGVYTFQFSATDNSGATSTSTSNVYVPTASAVPIGSTENSGAWTGSYTDLADASDSTYVQSSGSGTDTVRLAPIIPNSSLVITVRAAQTGTGATLTVTLLQGATTIATWTRSSLTSTPTDYALALTSTQVAAITNWNTLDLRFS